MRSKSIKRGVIVILVVCVLLAAGMFAMNYFAPAAPSAAPDTLMPVFEPEELPSPAPSPDPLPSLEPEEPETEEPPEEEEVPLPVLTSLPVRMRIPALELDYPVQSMGADASGTMQVAPGLEVVSWFDRSAIPGNEGNAIFGGHNMWRGVRSPVFYLDELEIGDELVIDYDDGTSMRFLLESVFVYELRLAPSHLIMDPSGEQRLTLITCKPPFNTARGTSDNRIVAIFKEESVFVIPDPPVEKFPPRDPPLY